MNNYDLYIFDLDGTIIRSEKFHYSISIRVKKLKSILQIFYIPRVCKEYTCIVLNQTSYTQSFLKLRWNLFAEVYKLKRAVF
jgi:beta-phosphoglucomutase-like phosphatase (HAD superfamily)